MLKPVLASLGLLALAGCVAPPPQQQQAGYYPGKPGMAAEDPDFTYYDNQPVYMYEGEPVWVVYDPGMGWGWWDRSRRWHHAPPHWRGRLDGRHPGGRGLPPPAFRPGPPHGAHFAPAGGFRPPGPPPAGGFGRPAAPGFAPAAPPPGPVGGFRPVAPVAPVAPAFTPPPPPGAGFRPPGPPVAPAGVAPPRPLPPGVVPRPAKVCPPANPHC